MSELPLYDVIVIGGGPAGSTVARYAAVNGADVLVIDGRDTDFGKPRTFVVCDPCRPIRVALG